MTHYRYLVAIKDAKEPTGQRVLRGKPALDWLKTELKKLRPNYVFNFKSEKDLSLMANLFKELTVGRRGVSIYAFKEGRGLAYHNSMYKQRLQKHGLRFKRMPRPGDEAVMALYPTHSTPIQAIPAPSNLHTTAHAPQPWYTPAGVETIPAYSSTPDNSGMVMYRFVIPGTFQPMGLYEPQTTSFALAYRHFMEQHPELAQQSFQQGQMVEAALGLSQSQPVGGLNNGQTPAPGSGGISSVLNGLHTSQS